MFRLIPILVLLPVAYIVLAAPSPNDSWELPIDPNNDYKLDIKPGTVTMELPGGDYDFDLKRKRFNAPRLLRDVEGDFVVQVRVKASFRPSVKSSTGGEVPRVAAGLLIILADQDYMRLDYKAYRRTEEERQPNEWEKKGGQLLKPELFLGYTFEIRKARGGSVYEELTCPHFMVQSV